MPVSRNVKIVHLSNTLFGQFLAKHWNVPEDTRVRKVTYHTERDCLEFLIEHESFPELYEGEVPMWEELKTD